MSYWIGAIKADGNGGGIRGRARELGRLLAAAGPLAVAGIATLGLGTSTALAADDCSNAPFRTGPSAALPDCRAFEQVSPVYKNGNSVKGFSNGLPNAGWSSAEGDTVLFNVSQGPVNDDPARGFTYPQVAERGADGWTDRSAANGPASQGSADGAFSSMYFQIPSADRKHLLFSSGSPFTADNPYVDPGGNGSVNLARGTATDWLSKPTWAGASPTPGAVSLRREKFMAAGGSEDLSTSYFMSRATLTAADGVSGRVPDDDPVCCSVVPGSSWALYRWKDGQLSNAGVLPDGTVDPGGSVAAGIAPGGDVVGTYSAAMTAQYSYTHSVSSDGKAVLFVSPDPKAMTGRPSELYLAREGQPTVRLSKWTGSGPAPGTNTGVQLAGGLSAYPGAGNDVVNAGVYAVASRDQQVVLFSTTDALTSGAPVGRSTVKTYRYEVSDGTLTYLPDLDRSNDTGSPGTYLDNTDGLVYNLSDDGTRMLYRSAGGELRLWREGQSEITLSTGVGPTSAVGGISESRFSSDGHTLVLMSRDPLAGETNHPPSSTGNAPSQVYRYDEDQQPTPQVKCLSCPPPTATVAGAAAFTLQGVDNGFGLLGIGYTAMEPARGMSDDGKTVFFTTTSQLAPGDDNAVADVYQWRAGGPTPQLLTSGAAASRGEFLVDNNATGSDVFIVSAETLATTDLDDVYDLYDVRVDGGFAPKPVKSPCVDDACQPKPSDPPQLLDPTSPIVGQPTTGKQDVPATAKPASLKISRIRGSATQVRVSAVAPGAGKLRVSGSGLKAVSRTAKRAGTYTVGVKLTATARRTLTKKGRLKVRAKVRFAPTKGKAVTKTATVTIKRAAGASRKAR